MDKALVAIGVGTVGLLGWILANSLDNPEDPEGDDNPEGDDSQSSEESDKTSADEEQPNDGETEKTQTEKPEPKSPVKRRRHRNNQQTFVSSSDSEPGN